MSYLVLARKYRPQNFDEVVGQDLIVGTLRKALSSGRIAHAFLFTGSRGIGKTTIARLLAKALACETGIGANPCGVCTQCQQIASGTSLDVIEIDGASNTSVDNIRDLRETIRYQPASARFKVFIIDEVHMLSTSAFNALLKTLEEPPPHVKFIFATTEPHKIPVTILSRCQRYDFRRLSINQIIDQLKNILSKEGLGIDEDALFVIAQNAQGGMRDALSLTDQILSFTSDTQATLKDVTEILGLLDKKEILKAVHAILNKDTKDALAIASNAYLGGYDLKQLIEAVAMEFRHLAIAASIGTTKGLADLPLEDLERIEKEAAQLDKDDLRRLFTMALESIEEVSRSDMPKLALELAFLRMSDRVPLEEATAINEAIDKLEHMMTGQNGTPLAPSPKKPSAFTKATTKVEVQSHTPAQSSAQPMEKGTTATSESAPPQTKPVSQAARLEGVDKKWISFVESVAKQMPALGSHLEHGRLVEKPDGESLRIDFKQRLHYQNVVDAKNNDKFLELFKSFYHSKAILDVVLTDASSGTKTISEARIDAAQKAQEELEQKARENPLIKKALQLFGGEIRSVKRVETN